MEIDERHDATTDVTKIMAVPRSAVHPCVLRASLRVSKFNGLTQYCISEDSTWHSNRHKTVHAYFRTLHLPALSVFRILHHKLQGHRRSCGKRYLRRSATACMIPIRYPGNSTHVEISGTARSILLGVTVKCHFLT
jgi:hypothetical protein